MNKLIRKRFVVSSMTAISILLILLIGTINVINLVNTNNTARESLKMISRFNQQTEMAPEGGPTKPEDRPGEKPPELMGRNAYDTYMASNFFVVEFTGEGQLDRVDVSRTSQYTDEDAIKMAKDVIESEKTEGRDGKCIYMCQINEQTGGNAIYFLDTSANRRAVLSVLIASLAVGTACWLLMLLVTIILSRRATRPIAESFEKQKQFVTDAGHEYKTPLAIIQSNADAMELHMGENKWLNRIKEQVERLTGLTQDMLVLAKIDEGRVGDRKETVNVSDLVRGQLEAIDIQLKENDINLIDNIEDGLTKKCNRDDLIKITGILLDNSMKYGTPGGELKVRLENADKRIKLSVENDCDNLPDVPPEKLFERFYRSDKTRNQEKGGSGIGLSIAKAIVDSYGGHITGEYVSDSRIRFTVEI